MTHQHHQHDFCDPYCCNHLNKYPWRMSAIKQKVWNAYCSIYNIFILDRFLYIFVPYTLLKFFYNIQDANLYQKQCLLRHERRTVVVIVAACIHTATNRFLIWILILREECWKIWKWESYTFKHWKLLFSAVFMMLLKSCIC